MEINHPLLKRGRLWLRRHPKLAAALVVLAFVLRDLPQWLSSVWALRSSRPFLESLTNKMNSLPPFSIYWVTTPLGWFMLAVILYLLLTDRRVTRKESSNESSKLQQTPNNSIAPENNQSPNQGILLDQSRQIKSLMKERDSANAAAIDFQNQASALRKQMEAYGCADGWLHKFAKYDSENISTMVRVVNIHQDDQMNSGVVPYYLFTFEVANDSVYPVIIDFHRTPSGEEEPGTISFRGHSFVNKLELINGKPIIIWPRTAGFLGIRVKLEYPKEVSHIENGAANDDFIFSALKLDINGLTTKETDFAALVQEGRLNTRYGLRKDKRSAIRDQLVHYA